MQSAKNEERGENMKVEAKIKLKNIPTEKLVAELLRRDNVQMYACDLYKKNYRVHIDDYTSGYGESVDVPVPGHCDVLIIKRSAQ